jgi:flavin reductase (DIM6/NTAB) family NADH-FMN oxidoreductase RutF
MSKATLGPRTLIYPTPALLIGAAISGKSNFMTAAWCGVVNSNPPMISVSLQHHRDTLKGVKENNTFSLNIPSVDMVKETDYCGIVSGAKTDKVADCKFNVFYGKLKTAPMIEQCPVSLECKVVQILNLGSHEMVIGQVEETYITDSCLTSGEPDVDKMKPLLWVMGPKSEYREFGKRVGAGFSIGRTIKPKNSSDNPLTK